MLNKGTKFFVTWTPHYINGEENFTVKVSREKELGTRKVK